MNTWILLITENLARILSLVLLMSINVHFLRLKKDNIKQALTLDTFTIGISFLIIYLTFDVIIKNYLLINNTFPLLRDFALMLSGLIFIFSLCVPFIKKKGEEG